MTDREVEAAGARVARLSADVRCWLQLAALAGVSAAAAFPAGAHIRVALVASLPALLAVAAVRARQRLALLDRLALDEHAYSIQAVARHGERAAGRRQCKVIAARLESLSQAGEWDPLVVADRVLLYRIELDEVKRRFAAPDARVAPPQAIECRRLLTRCAESALYNPELPAEDLGAALRRIAAGIS